MLAADLSLGVPTQLHQQHSVACRWAQRGRGQRVVVKMQTAETSETGGQVSLRPPQGLWSSGSVASWPMQRFQGRTVRAGGLATKLLRFLVLVINASARHCTGEFHVKASFHTRSLRDASSKKAVRRVAVILKAPTLLEGPSAGCGRSAMQFRRHALWAVFGRGWHAPRERERERDLRLPSGRTRAELRRQQLKLSRYETERNEYGSLQFYLGDRRTANQERVYPWSGVVHGRAPYPPRPNTRLTRGTKGQGLPS